MDSISNILFMIVVFLDYIVRTQYKYSRCELCGDVH